jgi:hypothetical protein
VIGGIVLDAAALADLASARSRRAQATVDYAVRTMRVIVVPATAVMECWASEPEHAQAFLALFPNLPVVVIDDLDLDAAVDAGAAAAEAGVPAPADIIHAVHSATIRGWPVLSGRADEVRALAPKLVVESTR